MLSICLIIGGRYIPLGLKYWESATKFITGHSTPLGTPAPLRPAASPPILFLLVTKTSKLLLKDVISFVGWHLL
jgi:hypothetical protein